MSTAVIVSIADAVVSVLNAATLSQTFTAVRKYTVKHDLKDLDDLQVSVVPQAKIGRMADRGGKQDEEYRVDVGVQQRADTSSNTASDALMLLTQEVADTFLTGERLVGYTTAMCMQATNEPIYDPAGLRDKRTFTSVVTLIFRVFR